MGENEYRIKLGVELDASDIISQINAAEKKVDPITIKVDAETKELTKSIQDALKTLSKGGQNTLTLDTSKFAGSIAEIKSAVIDLKKVLGSLDDSANMKSLLASVNQIANAIGKVTDESETLAKSLSVLSKKDFGFNFNLKTGNANPLKAATDYGKEARRNAIPALQDQAAALQNLLGGYQQADRALERYLTKIHKASGISIKNNLVDDMSNTGSLAKQMEAIEKYIGYLKKIATEKGINLSGFDAQFAKTAEDIVDDTTKIQTGAKQTEEALEAVGKEMKQVFGGGIGAEQLSAELEPIVSDLNQIRKAVQNLSKGVSLDGLTASFDRLSEAIENLLANAEKVKGVLNSGFDAGNVGANINSIKVPKSTRKTTQNNVNSVIDGYLNELGIGKNDKATVRSKIDAFAKVYSRGAGDELYDAALSDLMHTIKQLGTVSKQADRNMEALLADLKGSKINASKDIYKSEFGDDWKHIKSKYKMLGSGTGLPVDSRYQELSEKYPSYFPEDIWNPADQLKQILNVYDTASEMSKNRKVGVYDEFGYEGVKDRVFEIVNAMQQQSEAEQKVAQDSVRSANIIAQSENKKRQEYEQTIQEINRVEDAIQDFENRINNPTSTNFDDAEKEIQGYQMAIDNLENYKSELASKASSLGEELQIDKLDAFKNSLQSVGMDTDAIDNVTNRIQNLGVQIDTLDSKRTASGKKDILSVDISGVDEFGNAIKLTEQYNAATGDLIKTIDRVSTVQQKAGVATDSFVKQQKTAVSNLTNQINQMNRSANDPNASRPIKDAAHLDSLKSKYNDIIVAIERMENASSDTFVDEQNNVRKLISEYKSLVSEYKNAENVSTKMKGTDFGSGLDIAKNDLEKFKAEAKDFPKITATVKELDKAIENVGDAASLNKFNDQLRVAKSELAKVKAETTAANRSTKVGIDVSGITSQIENIQRISPEIDKFETEINGAKVSVKSLLDDLSRVNTASDFSAVRARFKSFKEAAEAAGIAITETAQKTKSINDIKIKISDTGFNGFAQEVQRAHADADKLQGVYGEVENALRNLDIAMEEVYSADQSGDVKRLVAANEEYEASLKQVYSQLKLYQQIEKQAYDAEILQQKKATLNSEMESWLKENTRAARDFGDEIRRLQASLDGLDDKGVKLVGQQFKSLTKQAQAMGKTGMTTFDRLKSKAKEYMSYLSAAEMFMYAEQAFRSMFEQVKLIDSAMTELKKVTDETDASYNKFLSNAALRSKELGTTIDGLVSSTADFARLGYSFEESQGLAEVANVYAVVGDEIDGVEGATESLVSTLAAFKDELSGISDTDFAMDIIDKFNEVSNNFAISSGGIGEAMQRSASSLRAANNTIDESIALITAANTVVQDPTVVGTAFKTISMRIRGAKTELEEAGLETEGMVESTATLRAEIEALTGVDIMKNANEFKSTYQIMDELAAKWQDLTDIQQASVTELIAGKRQGNIVSSLMQNFDTARQALETSLNSSGSAMREHEKWSQSLEARLNKLKSTWQSLSQTFMGSDFLKSALDGIINLVNGLDKLIDTVGLFPTLVGTFAGGLSLFKNKGLFTFDKDVQSIKLLGTQLDGLKGEYAQVQTAISRYNSVSSKSATFQAAYNKHLASSSTSMGKYLQGLNGAKASMGGYITSLVGAKVASFALQAATVALNAAISMGVSLLISAAISGITKLINAKKELAEKVDDLTAKFQEQHTELVKNKSSFESQAKRYGQLAKGVDDLGNNVSLTADEYSEYQDIVNSVADQIPSLVQGYDSQGNAILSCKGSVEELTAAYEDLIKKQNDSVLKGDAYKDIEKDFKNAMKDAESNSDGLFKSKASINEIKALESLLTSNNIDDSITEIREAFNENRSDAANLNSIIKELEDAGVDKMKTGESTRDFLKRALTQNRDIVQRVVNDFNANLDAEAEGMRSAAQAALSNAFDFSDSAYKDINEKTQSLIRQVVGNFDAEQFDKITDSGKTVEQYINDMLDSFKNLSGGEAAQLEAAFDLQTKFNGGDISYGEYIQGIKNAEELIDDLNIDDEVKSQIKLTLNTEEIQDNYDALKKRLTEKYELNMETDKAEKKAEKFLNSLSASEYSVAVDLIANGKVNFDDFDSIKELRKYIEEQAELTEALNYTIAIGVEAEGIEAFNTAMAESVSGAGLSSEAIAALKSRYADLESEGYNLSEMFEETANGIHLNRKAVGKLEQKLASNKLAETDKQLGVLKDRYDELTTEIDNCRDASDRAALYTEQQSIVDKINDLATLAAQYEGLTSAYNAWQSVEESGSERDMYEGIIEGFETVGDEIKRGWVDDGTIKFLELLTGKTDLASKSGKQLKEIYDSLDTTIKYKDKNGKVIENTGYSISDFFTVDKDGNSTNTGVYNFLDTIGKLEEEAFKGLDVVKRDGKGNIIGFDFELVAQKDENGNVIKNGDQVIAEALGISEELVQIMVRAADDAGFVVNLEGAYTQLADLKTEAESARDTLISLQNKGLKELKGIDVNFNLDAEGNDLVDEQEKAVKLLDKFKKDGKIDLEMEGAQQALDIAEYLTIKLDDLTEPKIMQIDVSEVDEDLRDPIEKMQEIVKLSKEKNLVSLTGDKKEIKETQNEIDKVAKELEELDPEIKAQVGIDDNWDAKTIASKIEKGEVEIPAELELDVQMSDDLKDMRLMMMNQLGLVSDNEVKLKVGFDIDESIVDGLTDEQKEVVVNYLAEHEEVDNYTPEQKEALVKYIADGGNLDGYTPEEKQGIVKYLADGGNIENYTPEQKQAIVEYLTDSGDPDNWTPEQKEAVAKFKKDSAEVDNYSPEDKQAIAKFIKNSIEPDNYEPPNKTQNVTANLDSSEPDNYQPKDKKFTVKAILQKIGDWTNKLLSGGSTRKVVNGTANVNGTAFANGTTGRAFKHGNWSTKDSGTALVGELGTETLVRNGRYYTIGDTGAEFIRYEKGDIIFNHKQTEELFRYGKVTSGGGRGKAFASGTAFSGGSGGGVKIGGDSIKIETKSTTVESKSTTTKNNSGSSGSSGSGGVGKVSGASAKSKSSSSSKSTKEDFEETFDWIEVKISRLERAIDRLDKKASSTWRTWSSRNKSLTSEISKVNEEINLQEKAYSAYMKEANSVGLSSSWKKKVQNGTLDISTVKDEKLAEKIKKYQEYYEKALACKDAVLELQDAEAELNKQKFDNIAAKYDAKIGAIDSKKAVIEQNIEQSQYTTAVSSIKGNNYKKLVTQEQNTIVQLEAKKKDLQAQLNESVSNGSIKKYSEDWYAMREEIDATTLAIKESTTNISQYYSEAFDQINSKYDGILQGYDHTETMLNEYIAQAEAQGHIVSTKYYDKLISSEESNIKQLKKQQSDLVAARDEALESGAIKKNSQEWYRMSQEIDAVTQEIEKSETAVLEWNKAIRDIEWETFDLAQERISNLNDEAEFFIELMSSKKLYDDNGRMTNEGEATMGMHGQQYNTHMRLADNYGAEAARLNKEIEQDPYNQDLINRRDEMLELQRESILAAEQEKNAIRDLIEEGYNKELEALQDRIDKQNESLQSAKDLYDYQKKVKDQTKEIASLEKQMAAYSGDTSEESKAKVQEIKVALEEARENLQETEYEKYISDQSALLDNLYNEYEEILNSRLDNIDGLLSDAITAINENAGTIAQTLSSAAGGIGYTMSESMSGIWEEAKALDDADRATRVSQTKATIDALTTEGALLPSKAQDIITTLGAGSEAEATATLDLVNKMVANGEITKQEANRIIAALSTGDQQKVLETLNLTDQLIADGKMTQTDADAVVNALITGDAQATKNAENIIKQLVSNGNLSTKDSKTITDALNSAKDESVDIVTEYGEDFEKKDTKVNEAIDGIEKEVEDAVKTSDEEAKKDIKKNSTSTSAKKDPTKDNATTTKNPTTNKNTATTTNKNTTTTTTKKPTTTTSSGDGKAKVGDKVKFVSGKYYASSDGLKPTGTKNQGKQVYITKINTASWATHPYHISTGKKLGSGDLGWLKLKQLSGYASGKKNFANDEVAWTQENGQEFIIRPSDGAILTPIAKSDSVLNAAASSNIWDMANNPADFIRNNLNLGATNTPNNSNVQNSIVQHFDKVVFSMPNVHNYDEMLSQMQKDRNFERLVKSMTTDRIVGKSALAKGKAIR